MRADTVWDNAIWVWRRPDIHTDDEYTRATGVIYGACYQGLDESEHGPFRAWLTDATRQHGQHAVKMGTATGIISQFRRAVARARHTTLSGDALLRLRDIAAQPDDSAPHARMRQHDARRALATVVWAAMGITTDSTPTPTDIVSVLVSDTTWHGCTDPDTLVTTLIDIVIRATA